MDSIEKEEEKRKACSTYILSIGKLDYIGLRNMLRKHKKKYLSQKNDRQSD